MDNLLISSAEVLSIAFTPAEFQREELIPPSRIETAQRRFLRPVFGPLCDRLADERYAGFTEEYVKPALAHYVRSLVIGSATASVGAAGILQPRTAYAAPAPAETSARLRSEALRDARTLLDRAVEYVESRPEQFPEYDPEQNVRRRIAIGGGVILKLSGSSRR